MKPIMINETNRRKMAEQNNCSVKNIKFWNELTIKQVRQLNSMFEPDGEELEFTKYAYEIDNNGMVLCRKLLSDI